MTIIPTFMIIQKSFMSLIVLMEILTLSATTVYQSGSSLTSPGVWSLTRGSPAVDCHFTCTQQAELKGANTSSPIKRLQHLDNDSP